MTTIGELLREKQEIVETRIEETVEKGRMARKSITTPGGSGRRRFRARIVGTDETALSAAILALILQAPGKGFTITELIRGLPAEMQKAFKGCGGTVRGLGAALRRVVLGLLADGKIIKTGERSPTNLGRAATVYRVGYAISSSRVEATFNALWARRCHKFFVEGAPIPPTMGTSAASFTQIIPSEEVMVLSIGGRRVTIIGAKSVSVE